MTDEARNASVLLEQDTSVIVALAVLLTRRLALDLGRWHGDLLRLIRRLKAAAAVRRL